jgi:hypothetical protein
MEVGEMLFFCSVLDTTRNFLWSLSNIKSDIYHKILLVGVSSLLEKQLHSLHVAVSRRPLQGAAAILKYMENYIH